MDHYSELGEPKNGFRYKFLEPQEFDEALDLLEKYLFPCLIPVGYDPNEQAKDWRELFHRLMRRESGRLSYIAVHIESGEIAGLRMVDIAKKEIADHLSLCPPYFESQANKDIFNLMAEMNKDHDLFERYSIPEYVELFGLTVMDKYRQNGIAGELYSRGLAFLKKKGYKIAKVSYISPFSRRAGSKLGSTEYVRRYFHECKDSKGNILNPNSDPTDFISFAVFQIQDT